MIRSYLVDDELLAVQRLTRMLGEHCEIDIVGFSTNPMEALAFLEETPVEVLFLDIQMPGINGFELLTRLKHQPFVIFTTAHDEYALRAFQTNSIDYLLKPIEPEQLARSLKKLDGIHVAAKAAWISQPGARELLRELAVAFRSPQQTYPRRIASKVGDRICFLNLDTVTHFVAQEKLTFAVANGRKHCIDESLLELEVKLDSSKFLRIHRSTLLNLDCVHEINSSFAGQVIVMLNDASRTQLAVARDRVRELRNRML